MVAVFVLAAGLAAASDPVVLDVELARDLGDGLFASGDPTGALQWYRVARWLEPTGDELAGIQMRVGMGLEATGDPAAAADWYTRVDGAYTEVAQLRTGVCRFRTGSTQWGTETLAEYRTAHPTGATEAWLMEGVLWLEAGQPSHAATAFASTPNDAPEAARSAGLAARAGAPPLGKSSVVAAGLSTIPGLGQMYTGAMGPGWRNLALTGLLGGGTWMMMGMGADGHVWATGTGGALMAVGLAGWTVNVTDAWRRAADARDTARREHSETVRKEVLEAFLELPLDPSPGQLVGH